MKARSLLVAFLATGLCLGGWRAAHAANLCQGGTPDGIVQNYRPYYLLKPRPLAVRPEELRSDPAC